MAGIPRDGNITTSVKPRHVAGKVERPSPAKILRMMSWTIRKSPSVFPHLIRVFGGVFKIWITVLWWRICRPGQSIVAISLVEHLGDIVAGEPIARFTRGEFPRSRLLWFVRRPYADIVRNFGVVDDVVTVNCLTQWLLLWGLGIVDIGFDLHVSGRSCPKCQAIFEKTGPASLITYETYYNYGNLLEVECKCADLPPIDDAPILTIPNDVRALIDSLKIPKRFVVIHCKSNDERRDWPVKNWKLLTSIIVDKFGFYVIEIGTAAAVIECDLSHRRSLCGKLTVLQSAEVIHRADLFIGIDSGPAHLANAVKTPGLLLFGQFAGFTNHMPYSGFYKAGGARILRADGPAVDLTVAEVAQAFELSLSEHSRIG